MPADPLDHDPLFARVRRARPSAPAGFAEELLQRDRSDRRAARFAASAGVALVCAAVACIVWMAHETGEDDRVVVPVHEPSAPAVDPAPVLLGWNDLHALWKAIRREYLGVLQSCGGDGLARLEITRRPDGSARATYGQPSYPSPTRVDDCHAFVTAAMVLPPMPEQLTAVTFTLDATVNDATSKDWIDPIATFEKAVPVRAMRACLPPDRGHMIFHIELVHDSEPHTRLSLRLEPSSMTTDSDAQLACLLRLIPQRELPLPPSWPVDYVRIRVPVR